MQLQMAYAGKGQAVGVGRAERDLGRKIDGNSVLRFDDLVALLGGL
jgi:hypothetical protein